MTPHLERIKKNMTIKLNLVLTISKSKDVYKNCHNKDNKTICTYILTETEVVACQRRLLGPGVIFRYLKDLCK